MAWISKGRGITQRGPAWAEVVTCINILLSEGCGFNLRTNLAILLSKFAVFATRFYRQKALG